MDLAFLVDITQVLNILNLKLQGPGQLITAAYESVKAFSTKLRNSAFCKKSQSFHNMQISCGGGHSIQWWWICFCCWKPTLGICWLQGTLWHFTAICRPLLSWCVECPKFVPNGTYWLAVQQWAKAKFREAHGNADKTAQFVRKLPPCFPELSKVFSQAHTCVRNISQLWTSINASSGPGLVMLILKLYSGFQMWPPSGKMWLSCVSRSAAKCLARSRIVCKCIQGSQLFSVRFSTVLISYFI